jgi:BirA family biotin operon repressor/biotin-[acetyl-CoA-carboxylase] ligase
MIPFAAANALAEAVEHVTGLRVDCKWPNDLLLGGRKFAGILIEGAVKENTVEHVVIGIGINVNQRVFPEDFRGKVTSIALESHRLTDRGHLFRESLLALEAEYLRMSKDGSDSILASWLSRSTMMNKPVSILQHGETIAGVMKGLSRSGGLVVATDGEERVFFAGDTTILKT